MTLGTALVRGLTLEQAERGILDNLVPECRERAEQDIAQFHEMVRLMRARYGYRGLILLLSAYTSVVEEVWGAEVALSMLEGHR
jgi:hypothetical protein